MMTYYSNHCWCRMSHWDNESYDCRHIVSIQEIPIGREYHDGPTDDWKALVTEREMKPSNKEDCNFFDNTTVDLNPPVLNWLKENVQDRKNQDNNKGWCIGNEKYRSRTPLSLNIFFHRRRDAMKFIKEWSIYKKPVEYFSYFTETRKKLNFETNKLEQE